MVDVEFEWFDPQPATDFHGIKVLLRQLLETDAQLFDLSALTELILSQPMLGSTVKVDGNESDPYAFLTVLNLQEHKVSNIAGISLSVSPKESFWLTGMIYRTSLSLNPSQNIFRNMPPRHRPLRLSTTCYPDPQFRQSASLPRSG